MRKKYLATRLARLNRQMAVLMERLIEEAPDDDPIDALPPMEQAVIAALASGQTMHSKRIAKASGYAYGSRIRGVLADLCRRNLIVNGPDGYKLAPAGTPRPPSPDKGHTSEQESLHERNGNPRRPDATR